MQGGQSTAGEPTISQLEATLQLTMAFKDQITRQGVISREEMRVAMESVGLELPADMPLNSYTQFPSTTNHARTLHAMTVHMEQALVNLVGSFKRTLKVHIEGMIKMVGQDEPHTDDMMAKLKLVVPTISDFDWSTAREVDTPEVKAELEHIDGYMGAWDHLGQLSAESLFVKDSLYAQMVELMPEVTQVLERDLVFDSHEAARYFEDRLGQLHVAISTARQCEPSEQWTPTQLINYVLEQTPQFQGALPYRFQVETINFERMLEKVETMSEQDVLESQMLRTAEALCSFISDGWRLEKARYRTVDIALGLAKSIYNLKVLTA
ncbi:hypothetical protein [Xanthomonas phage RTH11]|nr:hypothetical protein [Xanthomonas phage RTH11]